MINLLPPEEKEGLLLEKRKRVAIILWVLVLVFLICLILILFSIKFYLQCEVETQKAFLLGGEKEDGQSEFQELQEKIDSANLTLTELNSFYQKKIYLTEILERISSTLSEKTHLTNLSVIFSSAEKKLGYIVSISGFAPIRENLFELKKNLEKESDFKEVYFPPANWVEPTDIDFFVTFEIDIDNR